jgi:hypothetical protein
LPHRVGSCTSDTGLYTCDTGAMRYRVAATVARSALPIIPDSTIGR